MNVGFEISAREDGCAEFRRFDPSRGAAGPALVTFAEDPRTGDAAALIGSLYYRDELEARLPDGAVCPSDSDAALALAAFHHGRLEGLEGEFALVVWDRARRRLIAMRDPLGSWPLYRSTSRGVVMVGTRLLPLARRQGVGPDPDFLASFLMGPRSSRNTLARRRRSEASEGSRRDDHGPVPRRASRSPLPVGLDGAGPCHRRLDAGGGRQGVCRACSAMPSGSGSGAGGWRPTSRAGWTARRSCASPAT